jgi:methyl-accepting chemotaxis protein
MLKGRAEAAIQKVVGAMNALNQGVKETDSGITQTKIGTESLSKVALNLKTVV